MSAWRDNLATESPVELPGDLLEAVDMAWLALAADYRVAQLSADRLVALDERLWTFDSWKDMQSNHLLDVWHVHGDGPPFLLCLVTRPYEVVTGRSLQAHAAWECRMLGLFDLPAEGGRALIRPESLGDKLLEVFKRREVDFPESPSFCESYYVLADDERLLRASFPQALLDHLARRRDLFIEIAGRDMLVLWPAVIGREPAVDACRYFSGLAAALVPAARGPYR